MSTEHPTLDYLITSSFDGGMHCIYRYMPHIVRKSEDLGRIILHTNSVMNTLLRKINNTITIGMWI